MKDVTPAEFIKMLAAILEDEEGGEGGGKTAAKWEKLPKGWTDESVQKFWKTLTGDVKHKVTKCMKQMEGKVDDTGAFCASLADKVEGPEWRSGPRTAFGGPDPHGRNWKEKSNPHRWVWADSDGPAFTVAEKEAPFGMYYKLQMLLPDGEMLITHGQKTDKEYWFARAADLFKRWGSAAGFDLSQTPEKWSRMASPKESSMFEHDLRSHLIRLAHENKELRPRILPLLKEAGRRDDPNRVVFKVVSQLGGVTHEMAIINMTAGNKKIPFDGTPEDLARTLQEAASTSLRFQSMDFLDGPEINVVKAPRVPEALAQRAIAQATVVVGAMFVALRGTSSGLEWTLLPRAPRMAATPRTAHGPVDLKNPDAMYYEIDPSTNKSKFYEFKIVPIGQESDRTASGNSVKVAGDPNTAAFVLMRRWGRLTDTGFSGRVDGYNEYWSSRNMAERSMYEQGRKRVSHGYTDVSGKREYPIGLGAAGFGWGGQAACRVIPELSQMKDAMKNALKTVSGADRWLAPVARQDSSMARKLQGLLAEVERSLSTVDTYLDEQMSYCR
jgi:hypothetical protein